MNRGDGYPPAVVADTPENRLVWDETAREIANLRPGVVVDIPGDWAQ